MEQLNTYLSSMGIPEDAETKLVTSLLAIAVLLILRYVLLFVTFKRIQNPKSQYRIRKGTSYAVGVIAIFLIGRAWFEGFQSLSTFLGLVSAGLAIAFKDPLVNIAGWSYIFWQRPFEVGDRVQIGDSIGDVIDQRLFHFVLLERGNWIGAEQSTGRMIFLPNSMVFVQSLANYSKEFKYIWNEISLQITFESNWKQAKQILEGAVQSIYKDFLRKNAEEEMRKAARKFLILLPESSLQPKVFTSVEDSGVLLSVRYPCDVDKKRHSQQALWERILDEFSKRKDIDFAYPTQRFYNNVTEGKEEARAN